MKYSDAVFKDESPDHFRYLRVDEFANEGWWRDYPDNEYNYTHDKDDRSGKPCYYVSLYTESYIDAYFSSSKEYLTEDKYGFSAYDSYMDAIEFGLDGGNRDDAFALIEYQIKFARYMGAKFIRISRKEDFPGFYDLICFYVDRIYDDCYIIEIEDPVEYEEFIHLRSYPSDKVSFHELCMLMSLGFGISESLCEMKAGGNTVAIDRHTRKIILPDMIKSDEDIYLSERTCPLLYFLSRKLEEVGKVGLTLGIPITGLDKKAALFGADHLIFFEDITKKINYFDILYIISKTTDYANFSVYIAAIREETFAYSGRFFDRVIKNVINDMRFRMTASEDGSSPTMRLSIEDRAFNNNLDLLKSFGIAIKSPDIPISRFKLYPDRNIAYVTMKGNEAEISFTPDKERFINVLKDAHFKCWKQEYHGSTHKGLTYAAVIDIGGGIVLGFRGEGSAPKIWEYFISELGEAIADAIAY
ncbi:MAG: hypothetical protein IJY18_03430 [Clostridia bacterium]|nr:hypothetical protein [Clostridia bacterium]